MEKEELPGLPEKGVYTLVIKVLKNRKIRVGALGCKNFVKGYYAYTGSALGCSTSLRNRILRHLQKTKKKRWHIDFLLADRSVQVKTVIAAFTNQKKECEINRRIKEIPCTKILVPKFGASDCKQKCVSHLLYLGERNQKAAIRENYEKEIGNTVTIDF